jgi:dienelactone hydrolase
MLRFLTLSGADLIASQGFYVVVPDFLKGEYATGDMFSGTEE